MANRLKRRIALSFSSWFCIPDQGMKDFEILSRASAFIVKARPNKTFEHEHHILTASHVVAPWKFPKYYPDPWLQFINENHMHYAVELRHDSGLFHIQSELIPVSYHHPTRDLAVLHLMNEDDVLKLYDEVNILPLQLATEQELIEKGQTLDFHGHDIRGEVTPENDARLPHPFVVNGSLFTRTKYQTFAKTKSVLPDGMCGGPVLLSGTYKACGIVEGIIPTSHSDINLRGMAEFMESTEIDKFLDDIENRRIQPLIGGEAAMIVSSDDSDPKKMSIIEVMKKYEKK